MPINKEAYLRYRIIDRRIRRKGAPYPDMDDLIEACETALGTGFAVSTIQKDIKSMKEDPLLGFNAPIKYSRSHSGYYYSDPDYSIGGLSLDEHDLDAIRFAADTLKQFKGVTLFNHFDQAVDKIMEAVNVGQLVDTAAADRIIQFEQAPIHPGSEHLGFLLRAIQDRKSVAFEYRKFSGEESRRLVHPYLLKEYRQRWYLIGMPEDESEVKTFGLDRMREPELGEVKFRFNFDFDPETYFKHAYGITAFKGAAEKVKLRFQPLQAAYVKSQPLHDTQQILADKNDHCDLQIEVGITIELIMDLLRYGDSVEVLAPESLRKELGSRLNSASGQYS